MFTFIVDSGLMDAGNVESAIKSNLSLLFNTRQGALVHLPTYGLPNLGNVYQGLPQNIGRFSTEVKKIVEQYEPRLKNVKVTSYVNPEGGSVISLVIEAQLEKGKKIKLKTCFTSQGQALIATN